MATAKKNYVQMTDDDLRKELDGLVKGLFNLRVRKVTDVLENPSSLGHHRRSVARIKTEMRARELKKEREDRAKKAAAPKAAPAPAKAAPAAKAAAAKSAVPKK